MESLKISVITPSFNQGQYIEQTILSVLDQDYANKELIIIDGGSTDNTVEIIKKYESRIAYWISEADKGQSDAINKGLAVARGDVFNWINSDDYLEPGALQAIADGFSEQPEKQIMCGYTHCFYNQTGRTSHTYKMGIRKTIAETILNVEMNQPGSFYRMSVIWELGCLNPSLRYVFDGELWFRFLSKYSLAAVGYTDKLIAHFRLHKSSKSVGEGFYEFYKEFLNIHLFLAKATRLPEKIISYLQEEQLVDKYRSEEWELKYLEKDKFLKLFADKYKFLLYKDKAYDLSRAGLLHSLASKSQEGEMSRLSLGFKLAVPERLLNIARALKTKRS